MNKNQKKEVKDPVYARIEAKVRELQQQASISAINFAATSDPSYQVEFKKLEFAIRLMDEVKKEPEPVGNADPSPTQPPSLKKA